MLLFTDGSDLKGVAKVQDIKYMKLLRYSLRVLTAWPEQALEGHESKYQFYKKCYTFSVEAVFLIPGILYLKNNFNELSFFELGSTYITVFMNVVAVSRLLLLFLKRYSDTIVHFVKIIHLFNHKDKSEYAMKTHILVHKMSHFFTLWLNVSMIIGILLFNATPLYNNIVSGAFSKEAHNVTYEHAVFFELPFDYKHNFHGYLVLFFFNWYISYICSSCLCIFDLTMSLIVFHLWGHVRILINNMENFPRPKLEEGSHKVYVMYSQEEIATVHNLLRENIRHHTLITKFITEMSGTFGPILLVYFGFHQATGCLLLLECSQMDPAALVRYGPLTLIFFQQMIQLSIVFELLGSSGESLSDAAYSIPWECMDKPNRQIVHILLNKCQKSMNIKAVDMVTVGVQTMAMIIKTSFSYFVMLKTFADIA